jgi:hypothetical protein
MRRLLFSKPIAYIAAAILIFFGVLFLWGSGASSSGVSWIFIGVISIAVGFGLIWLAGRMGKKEEIEIVQRIDLSGDVDLEKFTCQNCGGALTSDNIKMVAGAPVVSCPYCGTSYQLSEEPKW